MSLTILAALPILKSILDLGIAARDAWKELGLGANEIKTLSELIGATKTIHTERASPKEIELGALHLALTTQCFGHALGQLQSNRIFHTVHIPLGAPSTTPLVAETQTILKNLNITHITPGTMPSGTVELELIEGLTGNQLANPYYLALWNATFTTTNNCPPPIEVKGFETLEFERNFLLAWEKALTSTPGTQLSNYLESLKRDYKPRLLQELLIIDMIDWENRHTFGGAKRGDARTNDPLPFMPLRDMYVEPLANSKSTPSSLAQPAISLILQTITHHKIAIIQADFGMGKSLTAKMLTQRLAKEYRTTTSPSITSPLPIHLRCVDDLSPQATLSHAISRARKRHADSLGYSLKTSEPALLSPHKKQRTLFLIDGLDEISLGERGLESLFNQIKDEATDDHKFVVFTRPAAITPNSTTLKGIPIIELLPWNNTQVEDWLSRWRKITPQETTPTQNDLKTQGLLELSRTPILLLLIAHTWVSDRKDVTSSKAELYERFFQSIARGKCESDQDNHPAIHQASISLKLQLIEKSLIPRDATEPDAMLWLMSRSAWEDARLKQADRQSFLDKFEISKIIRNELDIRSNTPDIIESIQMGLLLALQANLHSEQGGAMLFGHKSFREFLIARYWATCLKAIVRDTENRKPFERALLGARLLQLGDRSFDFLMEILNSAPSERWSPGQPFNLSEQDRAALFRWAEKTFHQEHLSSYDGQPLTVREDQSAWLREATLAIASHLKDTQGVTHRDELTLRSMYPWFFFEEELAIIRAPRARLPQARLSGIMTFYSLDLSYAELPSAHISDSSHFRASFIGTNLHQAHLGNSNFRSSNFSNANLSDSSLRNSQVPDAKFQNANMANADLHGVDADSADCSNALLADANMRNGSFRNACLRDADLRDANMRGVALFRADLEGATLYGADLRGANLGCANLFGADLRGANLNNANLTGTNLIGADVSGASFLHATYDDTTQWGSFSPIAIGAFDATTYPRKTRHAQLMNELQKRMLTTYNSALIGTTNFPWPSESLSSLANSMLLTNDLGGAIRLREDMLKAAQRAHDDTHHEVLNAFDELVTSLLRKNDLGRALELQQHVLTVCAEKLGPMDEKTLEAGRRFLRIHSVQGTLNTEIFEKTPSQQPPTTIDELKSHTETRSLVRAAKLYRTSSNLEITTQLIQLLKEATLKSLSAEQPPYSYTGFLARTLVEVGETTLALDLQQKIIEQIKRSSDSGHEGLIPSIIHTANTLTLLGKTNEALKMLEQALEFAEDSGEKASPIADILIRMRPLHATLGDTQSASDVQQRTLNILLKSYGPSHLDALIVCDDINTPPSSPEKITSELDQK
ncbi:pentapeptide repeat-containing protein [Myxococcus sp. K38C18041901]|uniref:pentapeptide repeat-containing protein n=1 Tax=Myxococcus guangdongensis TaxID=2906760 RepID=UPI0020A79D87|nr:pentapeptide repeat-containing protein [Myxococcus guangdongensis]MCP3057488.1 pentapeptide repeat-containing protein [Myxococcus guangdongensis]